MDVPLIPDPDECTAEETCETKSGDEEGVCMDFGLTLCLVTCEEFSDECPEDEYCNSAPFVLIGDDYSDGACVKKRLVRASSYYRYL